ncbi:hypothetical protein K504DRAFT_461200 [Pleomassaria siparia CBS 279.74]|uniref:Uncharacterized protein n=1 Tax=Pleomassaria siparia CBS 279.74 TaxID=1314801 RepID=A0A6G1JUZ8_9PLEO|nr:hypothetical protein K504DRAFT_461200 [Pleomassaria siparia CBS 279.74]
MSTLSNSTTPSETWAHPPENIWTTSNSISGSSEPMTEAPPASVPTEWNPITWKSPHEFGYPQDGKIYMKVITHRCVDGPITKCAIKWVPEGSQVDGKDYVRFDDTARVSMDPIKGPMGLDPNSIWTKMVDWGTSTHRSPSTVKGDAKKTISTVTSPITSSTVAWTRWTNSTVSVPTTSSVPSLKNGTVGVPITSSNSSSSSRSTLGVPTSFSTGLSLTSSNSTTIITVYETKTATSTSATTSTNSSSHGAMWATPTWSNNTMTRFRPNSQTITAPASGWPTLCAVNRNMYRPKYFSKDAMGKWHYQPFSDLQNPPSDTIPICDAPAAPTVTLSKAHWHPQLQDDFHKKIATLMPRSVPTQPAEEIIIHEAAQPPQLELGKDIGRSGLMNDAKEKWQSAYGLSYKTMVGIWATLCVVMLFSIGVPTALKIRNKRRAAKKARQQEKMEGSITIDIMKSEKMEA